MRRIRTGQVVAIVAALAIAVPMISCENANQIAKEIGKPPEGAVKLRALQTRRFDTLDESALLAAATQTLQDLGFTVTESSTEVGVLSGSKDRDAEEGGQIAAQVFLILLLGVHHKPQWDKSQSIHITLVVTPIQNSKQLEVRAMFDRHITNNHGQLWRSEILMEAKLYQEFFDKLSQSAFLEAHEL